MHIDSNDSSAVCRSYFDIYNGSFLVLPFNTIYMYKKTTNKLCHKHNRKRLHASETNLSHNTPFHWLVTGLYPGKVQVKTQQFGVLPQQHVYRQNRLSGLKISVVFGRPFVKCHMLSDRCLSCPVCLSICLSVTLVYCDQTVGWIKMPLGMEVGLEPGHIVLDGDPAPPRKGHNSPQLFGPCLL